MFYKKTSASKFALISLMRHLNENGITCIDTQTLSPVVQLLGGKYIERSVFLKKIKKDIKTEKKLFQ